MKIAITLDGIISKSPLDEEGIDDDLYCLNQMANDQGWYASSRWFAAGHDVFFITARTNQEMTNRWLEEWAFIYNRVLYNIPIHYQYNAAVGVGCDIFITSSLDELPRHSNLEILTYFYLQDLELIKIPDNITKISNLSDIDAVIESWPLLSKKSNVKTVGQSRTLPT